MDTPHDITRLLIDARHGDVDAADALFPRVYDELRRIAHRQLRGERPDHTLNTTALVHEAYLKLIDQTHADWQDRTHFFAVSARAMRQILIDYARRRNAQKRGGGADHLRFDDALHAANERAGVLLALDDALQQLGALNERLAQVVELRFFGGLTIEETAEVMDCSPRTVRRDWNKAKAWLARALGGDVAS